MTGTPFAKNSPSSMGNPNTMISKNECGYLVLIILVGATLRLWSLDNIAVEHFDEGVYASNNLLSGPDLTFSRYPFSHLYAPPLVPYLSEIFRGPSSWQPILPGLIFGILTIPAVWWISRIWFGPLAGMIAGGLAAFSDFHILYSRTILTDVPMGFFLVIAVCFISLSYISLDHIFALTSSPKKQKKQSSKKVTESTNSSLRYAWVLAAVFTSLAWWTKYNGWLALAIGVSGVTPWIIFNQDQEKPKAKYLSCWAIIAILAYAVWTPVLFGLSSSGGYTEVSKNHKNYLVGLENWTSSLIQQYQNHLSFDGILSVSSLMIVLVLASGFSQNPNLKNGESDLNRTRRTFTELAITLTFGIFLVGIATWIGTSLVLILINILGGIGCLILILFQRNSGNSPDLYSRKRNCWILMAWFVGLTLSTPFYRAYPRLTLPWLIACWIGAGAVLSFVIEKIPHSLNSNKNNSADVSSQNNTSKPKQKRDVIKLIAILLALFGSYLFILKEDQNFKNGVPGWEDRAGLKNIAGQIVNQISKNEGDKKNRNSLSLIATFGQPALYYHLGLLSNQDFSRNDSRDFIPIVVGGLSSFVAGAKNSEGDQYLILSRKKLETELKSEWILVKNQVEQIETYQYFPSKLVNLNQYSPDELDKMSERPMIEMVLFKVR